MPAPDRIWLSASYNYVVWTEEPEHLDARVEYLRAKPELLALIEAAKEMSLALQSAGQIPEADEAYVIARDKQRLAALAFAKSQDHPDAG